MNQAIQEVGNLLSNLTINNGKMSEGEIKTMIDQAVMAASLRQKREFDKEIGNLKKQLSDLELTQTIAVEEYKEIEISPLVSCNESLDVVKSLPEFEGKIEQYVSWRQAAHTAYKVYTKYEGSSKYYQAVAIIRNKIRGSADAVLASFNTVLNFKAIIARLDFTYADKRPIYLIEQELSTLRQGNRSVLEFYDQVEQKLTLLTNKTTMTYDPNVVPTLNEKYRADALRTFISGLKRPLCDILFSSRPSNLPAALALAQEVEANHERYIFATSFANRSNVTNKSTLNKDSEEKSLIKNQFPQKSFDKDPFIKSQPHERNPHFTKTQNQFQQKQVDTPEPMDIDPSTSRYRQWTNGKQQNYDSQNTGKRHNDSARFTGPKIQRINQMIPEQGQYSELAEEHALDLEVGVDNINFLGVNPSFHS